VPARRGAYGGLAVEALTPTLEQISILERHETLGWDPELPRLRLGHKPIVIGAQLEHRIVDSPRHVDHYISK
jgi:hypothetical protein